MRYVGAVLAPPSPGALTPFELVNSAGGGAFHLWVNPKALYDSVSDKTFWGFIRSDGHPCVAEMVNSTGVVTVTSVATTVEDLHACPAIHMRSSDRRLIVAYTKHNIAYFRARISTNAADSTAWGTEINLAATLNANNLTYPNFVELSGETAGTIHLFFRNWNGTNFSWRESVSTDDGASWPAATSMYSQNTLQAYCFFTDNGVDTIHIAATDTIPTVGNTVKMGHAYRTGASWFTSDGTGFTPGSGIVRYTDLTEFWDGTGGAPWSSDFCLDGTGKPVMVHFDGVSSVDWRYNISRWDGAAWGSVLLSSGYSSVPNAGMAGGLAINRANVDQLYVAAQQPSGRYEMESWVSSDGGATFPTRTSITTGSAVDQVFPVAVRDSAQELRVVWLGGTFNNTSWTDYTFAMNGASE